MGFPSAVHGLDSFWDDDDERGADQHTCTEERDDAQLSRREGEGEWKAAGKEGAATISYDTGDECLAAVAGPYAIAMSALKVSNMKRPSHMLRVVCGRAAKSPKKKEKGSTEYA